MEKRAAGSETVTALGFTDRVGTRWIWGIVGRAGSIALGCGAGLGAGGAIGCETIEELTATRAAAVMARSRAA